jgi:hypothetical protein
MIKSDLRTKCATMSMTLSATTCGMLVALAVLGGCDGRPTALKVPSGVPAAPAGDRPADHPETGTFVVELNPPRLLDLLFMIDNSPSMAPKQEKLRDNFPRLIRALENPNDGSLPDLRIALITSDLGTGGAYWSGTCAPKLLPNGDRSNWGDLGRFQMIGARQCGVTEPGALWLEYAAGRPVNFTGDIQTVFACLAGNLGTLGCGMEHQLQAFESALVVKGIGNEAQAQMLRPDANLALVFLTDEDDCSAGTHNEMYGDRSELRNETASLRCTTRGVACGGRNLSESPPGYPTDAPFEAPSSTCVARADACPDSMDGGKSIDTSKPTTCSPLRDVKRIADELKGLKASPDAQLFVVGIFGWPLRVDDMETAITKIALIPNPNTADTQHRGVFDVWPICYDPDHPPSNPDPDTGFDPDAAGWGGVAGFRLSTFIDEFGANGSKFSICQPDFWDSMRNIGGGLARRMQKLCVPESFARFSTCAGNYLVPDGRGGLVEDPNVIPLCEEPASVVPCYRLVSDPALCPGTDLLVQLDRGADSALPIAIGTQLQFHCQ